MHHEEDVVLACSPVPVGKALLDPVLGLKHHVHDVHGPWNAYRFIVPLNQARGGAPGLSFSRSSEREKGVCWQQPARTRSMPLST